jgi:hypothetical protein
MPTAHQKPNGPKSQTASVASGVAVAAMAVEDASNRITAAATAEREVASFTVE